MYECISGLKVNLSKSCMAGIGVSEVSLSNHVDIIGCKTKAWPLKYLGMPLGGNPRAFSFWEPVLERIHKKLANWKKSYISLGGRITLIKATLSNASVYYMSLFKMPKKIQLDLEKCEGFLVVLRYGEKRPPGEVGGRV